jgi:Amt family ammonium transporter
MEQINYVDTLFVLLSAALVMLMTPALAFFYGGMVRRKNILNILMQCFACLAIFSVQWVLFGYSLAFAPGDGFWGGFDFIALKNVGFAPFADYSSTIPHNVFMVFQMMFAVITPALIIGAFAERMKFSSFIIFIFLWATFVYDPLCHWVWGSGGWLRKMGVLDFAGGIVVHTSAGIAALVTILIIGKRNELENHTPAPHNLPLVALGTGLLWFGWFGFNAGSALAMNDVAVNAFIVTNTAAAMAAVTWSFIEWVRNGTPTVFGLMTGSIAGLATITPTAGFVTPASAIIIGILAGVICFYSVAVLKVKCGYDDSLDAFGVHGVGGILGTLAVGVFATKSVNAAGADGLLSGNPKQLLIQAIGIGVAVLYTAIATFIIYKLVDILAGVRVSAHDENVGLDLTQHRERAYTMLE